MGTQLTLRLGFTTEDFDEALRHFLRVMTYGSGEELPILARDPEELCEYHDEPKILEVKRVEGTLRQLYDVRISLPLCLTGLGTGLAQLIATASYYSVFSRIEFYSVRDIVLPELSLKEFRGPRFGVQGIRSALGVDRRPLFGMILKPRMKISLQSSLAFVKQALRAGVDYVIDDELVISPRCCTAEERTASIVALTKRIEQELGRSFLYFQNVSADIAISKRLIERCTELGVRAFVLNCVSMGFSAVRDIIDHFDGEAIFAVSNVGRGIMTRTANFSISEEVVAVLSRLAGGDAVYTGPLTKDFAYNCETLEAERNRLQQPMAHILGSFVVSSGAISAENILNNQKALGKDVMLQMGHGLFKQPAEIVSQVKAVRFVLDAIGASAVDDNEKILSGIEIILSNGSVRKEDEMGQEVYLRRIKDIDHNIERDFELLRRLEDELRTETRALDKTRIDTQLEEVRDRILDHSLEREVLAGEPLTRLTRGYDQNYVWKCIASEFLRLFESNKYTELNEVAETILKQYPDLVTKVASLQPVAGSEKTLDASKKELEAAGTASAKLKLVIPIIPAILSYESEVSLQGKGALSALWKRVVTVVRSCRGKGK